MAAADRYNKIKRQILINLETKQRLLFVHSKGFNYLSLFYFSYEYVRGY